MSNTTAAAIAAATTAALAIKAVAEEGKEAKEAAFRISAEATATALETKGVSAVAIAAANKAAGAGYGSDSAVGFHALTGQFLRLVTEDSEWDGTGQSLQGQIKKIGQPTAKAILKKAKTIDEAIEAVAEAVAAIDFDVDKAVAALLKAAQKIEAARLSGASFVDIETGLSNLDSIQCALANILDPKVLADAA